MKARSGNQGRRTVTKERLLVSCYHFLENIDGERGCRLVPYRLVQQWKMNILEIL